MIIRDKNKYKQLEEENKALRDIISSRDETIFDLQQKLNTEENYTKYCKDKRKMYEMLINKYQSKQVIVAIEELSELQKELCKTFRGQGNKEHIAEEIADVLIMIEQMIIYFGIDKREIDKIASQKVQRTKERCLSE